MQIIVWFSEQSDDIFLLSDLPVAQNFNRYTAFIRPRPYVLGHWQTF